MRSLLPIVLFVINFFTISAQSTFPNNRFVDWQHSGAATLDFSAAQLIDLAQLSIDTSGQTDCSVLVNQVIVAAQNQPTILHFPAGNFYFAHPVNLKSNLSIEGEGVGQTHLHFNLNQVGSAFEGSGTVENTFYPLLQVPVKNQQYLICETQFYQPGDWVRIRCNDSSLVTSNWAYGTVGQLVRVANVAQDTLFLSEPIRRSYTGNGLVQIQKIIPLEHIQIKCLSIERLDDTDPAQESTIQLNYVVHSVFSHLAFQRIPG